MRHQDGRSVSVPVHASRDMPRGTLRNILAVISVTDDDFLKLL